jgi:hypothetical protein
MSADNGGAVIDVTAAPSAALVPAGPSMIRPVGNMAEIVDAWEEFGRVKKALLHESDYQSIQGRTFVKKSGWRKIAAAFGISLELREEHRDVSEDTPNTWGWEVVVRAIAPNGRYCDGTASCWNNERRFSHPQHDVRAQAYTRAANRAISDLVGGGEVSAEEMRESPPERGDEDAPLQRAPAPSRRWEPRLTQADRDAPIGDSDLCTAIVDEMERTQTTLDRVRSKYRIKSLGELTRANAEELLTVLRRVKDKPRVAEPDPNATEVIV